jgi:outer membrane protein assembly factor BamB
VQTTDPLIFDRYVFITQYDEKYGSVLLEIEGGEPKVVWESLNMYSNVSSPVMIDGYVYGVDGGPYPHRSSLQCLDAKTGELMWEEKLNGKPISLMAADGKLIILDEKGMLFIAEATPSSYKEISRGDVLGSEGKYEKFWTPPVLYREKIYCRDWSGSLICIDVSK